MQKASQLFNDEQRKSVKEAVASAEGKTSCEIVPVVATASGRYDRAEDMVGLWFAVLSVLALWFFLPKNSGEPGSWGGFPLYVELLILAVTLLVSFIIGAVVGSHIAWLRRLFTPRKQMREEVASKAREAFFNQRVHHTAGATGLLVYVSVYEHIAMVLGDQEILDNQALGQAFLDKLCKQLTKDLREGKPTEALCKVIEKAGEQLKDPLPRAADDVNELEDALILID